MALLQAVLSSSTLQVVVHTLQPYTARRGTLLRPCLVAGLWLDVGLVEVFRVYVSVATHAHEHACEPFVCKGKGMRECS